MAARPAGWRHQIDALAAAGYHAVAPDQRGYGGTDAPEAVEAYTLFHLVGDMVALVGALGETQATIVGHDWGANVAWQAALWRPDVFPAVAALSVWLRDRGREPPTAVMKQMFGGACAKDTFNQSVFPFADRDQ